MAKLHSDLARIARDMPEAGKEALLRTGADIVTILKQPGFTPRDTGNLQDSYGAVPVSSEKVLVGTDVEYAPPVEFGGANSPAQPHLSVAFQEAVPIFRVRLKQAVEKTSNKV